MNYKHHQKLLVSRSDNTTPPPPKSYLQPNRKRFVFHETTIFQGRAVKLREGNLYIVFSEIHSSTFLSGCQFNSSTLSWMLNWHIRNGTICPFAHPNWKVQACHFSREILGSPKFSPQILQNREAESRPLLDRKRLRLLKEQLGGEFFAETQIHLHGMWFAVTTIPLVQKSWETPIVSLSHHRKW